MKLLNRIILILFIYSNAASFPQTDSVRIKTLQIIEQAKGKVGVAVINLKTSDTLTVRGNEYFPMQSVYKFPLALAVLDKVDKGEISLDKKLFVSKSDLLPNTWSPLRDKYPDGNVFLSLDEILSNTVSLSDNNGCDILFRLMGGTAIVDKYIHNLGIEDIDIAFTEEEMHKDWQVQYKNRSTPLAMAELLYRFYYEDFLSKSSKDYLWRIMAATVTGPKRIKGLLTEGTVVAHKTGSSGEDENGIAAATNDAGIVQLDDGSGFVIVVFVSDAAADEETREKVIAQIAKTVYDAYLNK
ncbi:MAG: class A beta-lactamase, subclass A2 [Ignavibacteriales bacterium]|nr:MAG: class A beta-lactamase, subclass A2 [Ignavibacteriales bacterium]